MEIELLKTGKEILLVSAPANDDADYEEITALAAQLAVEPLDKWLKENDIKVEYYINWGTPWGTNYAGDIFHINYLAKIIESDISDEALMVYKLKYYEQYPITNLKPYIDELFVHD